MRRILASALILGLFSFSTVGLIGCGDETKVKDTKEVKTPTGSDKITTETTEKKTGDAKTNP